MLAYNSAFFTNWTRKDVGAQRPVLDDERNRAQLRLDSLHVVICSDELGAPFTRRT